MKCLFNSDNNICVFWNGKEVTRLPHPTLKVEASVCSLK